MPNYLLSCRYCICERPCLLFFSYLILKHLVLIFRKIYLIIRSQFSTSSNYLLNKVFPLLFLLDRTAFSTQGNIFYFCSAFTCHTHPDPYIFQCELFKILSYFYCSILILVKILHLIKNRNPIFLCARYSPTLPNLILKLILGDSAVHIFRWRNQRLETEKSLRSHN